MIETVNLTKRFDDIVAVDHISAQIKAGSVFGLIGTNGAGKSTFLRMVSGVLKADEGTVAITENWCMKMKRQRPDFFTFQTNSFS